MILPVYDLRGDINLVKLNMWLPCELNMSDNLQVTYEHTFWDRISSKVLPSEGWGGMVWDRKEGTGRDGKEGEGKRSKRKGRIEGQRRFWLVIYTLREETKFYPFQTDAPMVSPLKRNLWSALGISPFLSYPYPLSRLEAKLCTHQAISFLFCSFFNWSFTWPLCWSTLSGHQTSSAVLPPRLLWADNCIGTLNAINIFEGHI